jgi:ABC-type Fe3+-hydroxamate transport system substrate-binding protein
MIIQDINAAAKNYQRIVCLVPSLSNLLYDLGLNEQLLAVTKFCIHPKSLTQQKHVIGGTKNLNLAKIASLKPDLIIANKEENVKEQIEKLAKDFPVLLTDINSFDEAIDAIVNIGILTEASSAADALTHEIKFSFSKLQPITPIRAAYLIWKDPFMTVGSDTFIHDMMQKCGLINAFGDHLRYPEIQLEELSHENIKVILLSSEPYPFKKHHLEWINHKFPDKLILLADGEMFSWYGSKMLHMPEYFETLHAQIRNYVL